MQFENLCRSKMVLIQNFCRSSPYCPPQNQNDYLFVMESPSPYKDLEHFIIEKGKLEEPLARKFFRQVVETVMACHSQGVSHLGIRDTNLLVDLHTLELKLINFGYGAYVKEGNASESIYTHITGD